MDLTATIIPKSDQINADDLIAGPRTFTVTEVRVKSSAEQPVDIHLAESPGKPFRPSKTVLRVLVTAWGKEGADYVGRRMTLYRDPEVKWAGQEVGGIRVSHLSHITKQMKLALTETRGKKVTHIVQPLKGEPAKTTSNAVDADQLRAINEGLVRLGITEGEAKLATVAQVIDREVASSKELTKAEASALLDWIRHEESQDADGTIPGTDAS
jgi:hypothetical protein